MRGLVLAGGGVKGAYQIGVWKALRELEIDIDVVCGTSIGALNGAFFAMNAFSKAYDLWSNMEMSDLIEADASLVEAFDMFVKNKKVPLSMGLLKNIYSYVKNKKGIDVAPLRRHINNYLDEDILRNSSIDYGLVTYSLDEYKSLKLFKDDIPEGMIKHYLLGSAMIPGFAREEEDPIRFVDGFVTDNFPVQMAIDRGCNEVIAVSLNPSLKRKKYKNAHIIHIQPQEDLGIPLHVENEKIHKNMRMGYLDALKEFGVLFGDKFYFKTFYTEHEALLHLAALPFRRKRAIHQILSGTELLNERNFFEKTLPKLAKQLNLTSDSSYRGILHYVFEQLMEESRLEQYRTYHHESLRKHLKEHGKEKQTDYLRLLL